ncbi:hypothetical protein K469DRAFT_701784 [Zopfia rhizophila CBS 207.26]|uniref:Protein artemis n=1 Tax=Zopfia rhizophila CBS 207.26 TaxID=1314779 RepID=A0A6A6EH25_9PEZI|nr:hypothetical protein K469DRAFT_701784 [Zopfia rhizophila CBS 207.26]
MRKLAKPLPLETPTVIELAPSKKIRVTLFDANHCVGAVMFLVEGDGKAVLYTGDIRAETWWVNSLVRNPVLIPYTLHSKRLDCIYLDNTFATKSEPYREFPSKAEGIRELLEKVEMHSKDAIFFFHSWTFGYENVWIALSSFLHSPIHLDSYRYYIYSSLSPDKNEYLKRTGLEVREAPALCGFKNGNHYNPGCLTSRADVRLHSCERGMGCSVMDQDADAKVVHIIPIVTRVNSSDIAEIGAGGGKGDLDQKDELETDDVADVGKLMELCAAKIDNEELLSKVLALLQEAINGGDGKIKLGLELQKESQDREDDLSLQSLVSILSSRATASEQAAEKQNEAIRFPYSRHSSYSELCALVNAFKPGDVYPCTVDESNWRPALSMRNLFGPFCSAQTFRHDTKMREIYESRLEREITGKRGIEETQGTQTTEGGTDAVDIATPKRSRYENQEYTQTTTEELDATEFVTPRELLNQAGIRAEHIEAPMTSPSNPHYTSLNTVKHPLNRPSIQPPAAEPEIIIIPESPTSAPSIAQGVPLKTQAPTTRSAIPPSNTLSSSLSRSEYQSLDDDAEPKFGSKGQRIAYKAALGIELTWADLGGLVSTRKPTEIEEEEL